MALSPGTRLGPYEIGAQIGAGGMGEVYRATDTNLARQVAIKVLPEAVASDRERLARFDREAKTLAALNHPNIAQIHGLDRSGNTTALVMELVEGPTLADRIAEGPIPIDDALAIAAQIAGALEAAHEQGIVHRDLKPANVKVRADGTVKVLDFGLAKAIGAESASATGGNFTQSPTITTPAMTQLGMILGTAAYMSPEQAKGKPADKRSDVWAFGCVLYEMLSGRRTFEGEDVSDTLAFVLTKEPDWSALLPEPPVPIHRLLRRSLAKDRRARLSDVTSAKLDIDEAQRDGGPASPAHAARNVLPRSVVLVADVSAGGPLKIRVMAVEVTTTPAFKPGAPRVLFEGPFRKDGPFRQFDVSRDGRFLMVREVPRPPTRITHMVWVQNWLEELRRLVPVN